MAGSCGNLVCSCLRFLNNSNRPDQSVDNDTYSRWHIVPVPEPPVPRSTTQTLAALIHSLSMFSFGFFYVLYALLQPVTNIGSFCHTVMTMVKSPCVNFYFHFFLCFSVALIMCFFRFPQYLLGYH